MYHEREAARASHARKVEAVCRAEGGIVSPGAGGAGGVVSPGAGMSVGGSLDMPTPTPSPLRGVTITPDSEPPVVKTLQTEKSENP